MSPYRPARRCTCTRPECGHHGRCGELSTATRCPSCARIHKRIRNADRPIAAAMVAAEPWCHCTSRACGHVGVCGVTDDLTAEHIDPLAHGGMNEGPRTVTCRPCNSRRGAPL